MYVGGSGVCVAVGGSGVKVAVGGTGVCVAVGGSGVKVAVGVSGSFQHMAGMGGSKTVIAVNTDPDANIFKISDYGVVGEYEKVLPGLIAEISEK